MSDRPRVILDPFFRSLDDILSPGEAMRLAGLVEVVWGQDDPMPLEEFRAALPQAFAVQQGVSFAALVGESGFVEFAIDRFQDRGRATDLTDRETLRDRELERLDELGDDLRCSRLDPALRVHTVLHGVRVAGV